MQPDQKEEGAAAGNLWRKKLVLHGVRVDDDLVGYSVNPMAPAPRKDVGFATASSFVRRHRVAGEAGRRCRPTSLMRRAGPSSGLETEM